MEQLFFILPALAIAYSGIRLFLLEKRARKNRKILMALNELPNEDSFFYQLEILMKDEASLEFLEKLRVIQLWGDVYHQRFEAFQEHLKELNLNYLIRARGTKTKIGINEDSFFYLYLVIPNRLFYSHQEELRRQLYEKMHPFHLFTDKHLFAWIKDANMNFYNHDKDRGKEIYEAILNGEYGGYLYSKQLIGLYKDIVATMLAKLSEDIGPLELSKEEFERIDTFAQSKLGERWMKEIDYTYHREDAQK